MVYDVIIIGAGVGGLFGALELATKGKKILLLERQPVPGGVVTSFKRKGFTFEAAAHIVDALAEKGEVREILEDLGVSAKVNFIPMREFGRVIYPEHDLVVNADFDNLKAHLKEKFPQEEKGIDAFFRQIAGFYRQFDNFYNWPLPMWLKLGFSPILFPAIIKTSCITLEQFITKKIKDKKLRALICTIWGFIGQPPSVLSAFYFLVVFRGCWGEKTAYVQGGFSRIFSAMVERIRETGSEVKFNTKVAKIITNQGKIVKGVVTDKGEEYSAKAVISNANAIDTLTEYIDHSALQKEYAQKLSKMEKSISSVTVYLGLDVSAKTLGMDCPLMSINESYDHDESFQRSAAGDYYKCNLALVDHAQLDPGLAPAGKSAISVMTLDSYANWQGLSPEEYKKKKQQVGEIIVSRLDKYIPGISRHVEVLEVGTPLTMERFASLPQGAVYGFSQTVAQSSINRLSQETLIKGLFLCGAWTKPGCGVHGCVVSGRDAADLVLKFLK